MKMLQLLMGKGEGARPSSSLRIHRIFMKLTKEAAAIHRTDR